MTTVPRHGDIEIEQNLDFQWRDWRAQRIGRIAVIVIIVAALGGAFGDGLLSTTSVRSSDGRLEVEYDRIARHAAPQPLRIHVATHAPGDSVVDLWIDQRFAQGMVMREISPQPNETWAGGTRLMYRFRLVDLPRTAVIVFQIEPDELWARRGALGLLHGDSVRFRQFVLP